MLGIRVLVTPQAIEQLSHSRSITRDRNLRRDLVEWNENEGALGQARMRNLQIGFTEVKISHHQDIQIKRARTVARAKRTVSTVLTLESEKRFQ